MDSQSATDSRFDIRGTLALVFVVCSWGAMPVFLRGLTDDLGPWEANALRYPFAAILYWPLLWVACKRGKIDAFLLRRALVPAFFSLGGQVLWAIAPYYLESVTISFLIRSSIVWGVAGALVLFPDERGILRSPAFYLGGLLAAGGVLLLSISRGAFESRVTGTGVLVILGCGVLFGAYGVSVRYFLREVHPVTAFSVVVQYTAAGTILLYFLFGGSAQTPRLSGLAWLLILVSSLLGIAISHTLLYTAIRRLGAALTNMGGLAGPFVTVLLGMLFLGELMSSRDWYAGALLVVGGGLILLAQKHRPRASLSAKGDTTDRIESVDSPALDTASSLSSGLDPGEEPSDAECGARTAP